jgi:hypothetical protein
MGYGELAWPTSCPYEPRLPTAQVGPLSGQWAAVGTQPRFVQKMAWLATQGRLGHLTQLTSWRFLGYGLESLPHSASLTRIARRG